MVFSDGGRLLASFDLAEVRRFDTHPRGKLPDGERRIGGLLLQPPLSQVFAKLAKHVCSVYYTRHESSKFRYPPLGIGVYASQRPVGPLAFT